jgi:hypothetical protein
MSYLFSESQSHPRKDSATMESPLQREFEYFLANKDELLQQYNGKFVVIKDQCVIGTYADEVTAVTETQKTHPLGTFLVQKIEPGDAAYNQTFHSRVAFAR